MLWAYNNIIIIWRENIDFVQSYLLDTHVTYY